MASHNSHTHTCTNSLTRHVRDRIGVRSKGLHPKPTPGFTDHRSLSLNEASASGDRTTRSSCRDLWGMEQVCFPPFPVRFLPATPRVTLKRFLTQSHDGDGFSSAGVPADQAWIDLARGVVNRHKRSASGKGRRVAPVSVGSGQTRRKMQQRPGEGEKMPD